MVFGRFNKGGKSGAENKCQNTSNSSAKTIITNKAIYLMCVLMCYGFVNTLT